MPSRAFFHGRNDAHGQSRTWDSNETPTGAGCVGRVCSGAARAAGDPATRSHLGFCRDGGVIKQRDGFLIFLTPARAVHQPTWSCSVPVPTPSAHCRAGCPRGPRGRGLGRGYWTSTIKNSSPPVCWSGSGCLCLQDDEHSPNLGYLEMRKGSLGGGCGETSGGWGGRTR